jgi:hypothetical protein
LEFFSSSYINGVLLIDELPNSLLKVTEKDMSLLFKLNICQNASASEGAVPYIIYADIFH